MFKFIVLVAIFGLAAALPVDSDVHAEVKSLENEIAPGGESFHYGFQTSNGIDVASAGDANAIQGSYQYVSPEGVNVIITYVADADGYKPAGELLPVGPPIPEAIIRSLQWNEAHPYVEESGIRPASLKNLIG